MKFYICRTSVYEDDESPVDGSFKQECLKVDSRTFKSPEEHDERLGGGENFKPWNSEGLNHRIVDGGIARDFESDAWFIEIDSLEELMEFSKAHGELVVSSTYWAVKGHPRIEIYDGYRE